MLILRWAGLTLVLLASTEVGRSADGNSQSASTVAQAPGAAAGAGTRLPLDLSVVLSYRRGPDDDGNGYGGELTGTLYISKTLGSWQFHGKVNANSARELNRDGLNFIRERKYLAADVDAAWVNYNHRDWLQWRSGFLHIPTYWSTRRFQSATYTVADPLIDQDVFPAAFLGTMLQGDRFFEDGGVSYRVYGGKGTELDHLDSEAGRIAKPRLFGGKFVVHVPVGHRLDTFDLAFHRMRGAYPGQASEVVEGAELRVEKGKLAVLGDYARARVRLAADAGQRLRKGYSVQPSFRLTFRLTAVARYDNAAIAMDRSKRMDRWSTGLAFRPIPTLWLRADVVRYCFGADGQGSECGASLGSAYFSQNK